MSRLGSRRVSGVLAGLVIGGLIAFPLGILASHRFTDVADSNAYHADIDALADAGVTTGCGDGSTFCPSAFVTREQMAAFMNRLGALAAGKTPVVNATKLDGLDSTQFARTDVQLSGTAECGAAAANASVSTAAWTGNGQVMWATSATNVALLCEVSLPDGATVTEVRWEIFDDVATERVYCDLVPAPAQIANLATVDSTNAAVPGRTTLVDSTITGGLIDQATYNYFSVCTLTAADDGTGYYGVAVDYTVPGLVMP